mmetsp:Transcript_29347/g.80548  ORF Transcript_29347/g.80548 Transcript_29347/m.80548 type:complete len:205 (-) Transcript_29347:26-640(-)
MLHRRLRGPHAPRRDRQGGLRLVPLPGGLRARAAAPGGAAGTLHAGGRWPGPCRLRGDAWPGRPRSRERAAARICGSTAGGAGAPPRRQHDDETAEVLPLALVPCKHSGLQTEGGLRRADGAGPGPGPGPAGGGGQPCEGGGRGRWSLRGGCWGCKPTGARSGRKRLGEPAASSASGAGALGCFGRRPLAKGPRVGQLGLDGSP